MVLMAALWSLMLVPLFFFVVIESQSTSQLNQTDFEAAMADMRARSYHGFVILLKILEGSSANSLQSSDVTFLMPTDVKLSAPELRLDHVQNFLLSHAIPSPLVFNSMLHFPNGTLVPSGVPGKMLSVTNNRGLFFNNARVVEANVCVSSMMKCHGISSAISFDNYGDAPRPIPDLQAPNPMDSQKSPAQADAPHPTPDLQAPNPMDSQKSPAQADAPHPSPDLQAPNPMDSQKSPAQAKPSPSFRIKRNTPKS